MSLATHDDVGRCEESPQFKPGDDNGYERLKICLERVAAVPILLAFLTIVLPAMALVRVSSPGLAIYTQWRLGRGGRTFPIHKIRTMYRDSERFGPKWCVPGDPRVTPVGRVLRRFHIDELPQLINVIRGEMSFIGPRPERPEIAARLERVFPNYRERLVRLPGLTGLAQVLLPPDTTLDAVSLKLRYDRYYMRHAGPWLDLRIVLATACYLLGFRRRWIARVFRFPLFESTRAILPPSTGDPEGPWGTPLS